MKHDNSEVTISIENQTDNSNANQVYEKLVQEIREILKQAKSTVARQVNEALITANWNIGKAIVEYEQGNNERAEYGKHTLVMLSKKLTHELGKGFSVANIQFMRRFYLNYKIQ